jgi:hypothetical protein
VTLRVVHSRVRKECWGPCTECLSHCAIVSTGAQQHWRRMLSYQCIAACAGAYQAHTVAMHLYGSQASTSFNTDCTGMPTCSTGGSTCITSTCLAAAQLQARSQDECKWPTSRCTVLGQGPNKHATNCLTNMPCNRPSFLTMHQQIPFQHLGLPKAQGPLLHA